MYNFNLCMNIFDINNNGLSQKQMKCVKMVGNLNELFPYYFSQKMGFLVLTKDVQITANPK